MQWQNQQIAWCHNKYFNQLLINHLEKFIFTGNFNLLVRDLYSFSNAAKKASWAGKCLGKIAFGKCIKLVLPRTLGIRCTLQGNGGLWSARDSSSLLLLPPHTSPCPIVGPSHRLQSFMSCSCRGSLRAAVLQDKPGPGRVLHRPQFVQGISTCWILPERTSQVKQRKWDCIFSCYWKARSFIFCHLSPLHWDKILQRIDLVDYGLK